MNQSETLLLRMIVSISKVGIYVTFEVDPKLGNKVEMGSVNGLDVNQGQHITIAES